MKEIGLTQGQVALVDEADFDLINRHRWFAVKSAGIWYAQSTTSTGTIQMHRLILPNAALIDHQDGNGLNNTRQNLREASHKQNRANSRKQTAPTASRFKGVQWRKSRQKWIALIRVDGKLKHLGSFVTETEAAEKYDAAALQFFGEFARLNFPRNP